MSLSEQFENFAAMIEIIGEKNFLELTKLYGGQTLYFPMYLSSTREKRNQEIKRRFDGTNLNQLATEYRLSVNQVRRILKERP